MAKKTEKPMPYDAREDAKERGRQLLSRGTTLAERIEGATLVLMALFERSRDANDYSSKHPDFSSYIRMLDLADGACLPGDVVAYLRQAHGAAIEGVIPPGTSDWLPRRASPSPSRRVASGTGHWNNNIE